jgi:hypothetical protein
MRFLADESCDFAVVRALRSADHDVLVIAEVSPREEDDAVMEQGQGVRSVLCNWLWWGAEVIKAQKTKQLIEGN